jgi:Holliday junction DNA helicase RuvA
MIAHLCGVLREKSADRLVVDVQGVGYLVFIPFSTYYEMGEEGSDVSLKIHTHVTENSLSLYGFRTDRERQLFLKLIQISGIGPRLAVTILSGLPVNDLMEAVAHSDVARLSTIPGVGKKTAERIALELKDKIAPLLSGEATRAGIGPLGGIEPDVVSALVNLGYPKNKAETAVGSLRDQEIDRFDLLLRRALKELAR